MARGAGRATLDGRPAIMSIRVLNRRDACKLMAGTLATAPARLIAKPSTFRLRYILASCMYGKTKLAEILPEVRKAGAEHLDIWPLRHGNQREQIETMGHDRFMAMVTRHKVKPGIITCYTLGPLGLQEEMKFAKKIGATMMISGSRGPAKLSGDELKSAVKKFASDMKPQVEIAERLGITIGIENHGHALICSPDSLRWFADVIGSKHIGIALAPYHLPQDPGDLAKLIEDLGPRLVHFYAWQHGMGCSKKLPKEQELLQMPGRGSMDFTPIIAALVKINYRRWTEIFMHPVPRGIPILPTTAKTTAEINRARRYLDTCLQKA